MSKRHTKKTETSDDVLAELIVTNTAEDDEFPDGFVHFACNQRWYGTYIVTSGVTVTGKSYQIEKTGTRVDIRDIDNLKQLRETVFCQRRGENIEIAPIGVASV